MWPTLLLSVSSAAAEPPTDVSPTFDRNVFDVQIEGAIGAAARLSMRGRVDQHLAIEGSVRGYGWATDPRYALGGTWSLQGHGLQGPTLGLRGLVGPMYEAGVAQGWSTELEPTVSYHWILRSGFSPAVELGFDTALCCDSLHNGSVVSPVLFVSIGWAFAIGDRPPSRAEWRALRHPERSPALEEPSVSNAWVGRMFGIGLLSTVAAGALGAAVGVAIVNNNPDQYTL